MSHKDTGFLILNELLKLTSSSLTTWVYQKLRWQKKLQRSRKTE